MRAARDGRQPPHRRKVACLHDGRRQGFHATPLNPLSLNGSILVSCPHSFVVARIVFALTEVAGIYQAGYARYGHPCSL